MEKETGKLSPKIEKGMAAYRLPKETLNTLKIVSEKSGIPTATIVARCLEKQKVLQVVRDHLAKATEALAEASSDVLGL